MCEPMPDGIQGCVEAVPHYPNWRHYCPIGLHMWEASWTDPKHYIVTCPDHQKGE